MCGIAALIRMQPSASPVDPAIVEAMTTAVVDRGPDGRGLWIDPSGNAVFGHTRLSTMDPRPIAAQPMASADGSCVVTFNGEIYNFADLRQELESAGARFRTRSDTEVLLQAYRAWGEGCLDRVEGQFSFVIFDRKEGRFLAARDPFGICPLYYARAGEYLALASEPRALFQVPGVSRDVLPQAVYHWIVMESTPLGNTLYRDVKFLRAGNAFRWPLFGPVAERRYAERIFRPDGTDLTPSQWEERMRWLLQDAVARRMVADKRVGLFLSGGVDSSITLALMRRARPDNPIDAFSVGFEEVETREVVGELPYARAVSKLYNARQHEIIIRHEDLIDRIPTFDLAPPSILELVFDAMAQRTVEAGVEVVLSGEGSDEPFFGYDHYFAVIAQMEPAFRPFREQFPLRANHAGRPEPSRITDMFLGGGMDISLEWDRETLFEDRSLLQPSVTELTQGFIDEYLHLNPAAETDKILIYVDLVQKMSEGLMRRAERPCMWYGLETRYPFLDERLIQAHFQMPMAVRLQDYSIKSFLKKCVADILPAEVLNRSKTPFGMPASRSVYCKGSKEVYRKPALARLFSSNYERIREAVLESELMNRGIFNREAILRRLESQADPEKARFDQFLWKVWSLCLWHRHWIEADQWPQSLERIRAPQTTLPGLQ